jgi:hypothetical protein
MPGHSRLKNGVTSFADVPGIHVLSAEVVKVVDGRDKPGHDEVWKERSVVDIFQ